MCLCVCARVLVERCYFFAVLSLEIISGWVFLCACKYGLSNRQYWNEYPMYYIHMYDDMTIGVLVPR